MGWNEFKWAKIYVKRSQGGGGGALVKKGRKYMSKNIGCNILVGG
jgi:hypothetical protein